MTRRFWLRSFELAKVFIRSSKGGVKDPSTPTKKRIGHLYLSLHLRRILLLVSRFQRWGDDSRREDFLRRIKFARTLHDFMGQLGIENLQNVKLTVLILALLNGATLAIAVVVAFGVSNSKCHHYLTLAAVTLAWAAGVRLMWMSGMAFAQSIIATTMISVEEDERSLDMTVVKSRRRSWYQRWLWWSRVGTIVTAIQVCGACYYTWALVKNISIDNRNVTFCPMDGHGNIEQHWLMALLLILPTLGAIIVFAQCCVGSDVLAWRLLYGAHYEAWKSHYRQMFDYGIRELLCCLGRGRYMGVHEGDEVDSVAALLGDLVAYRAVGASHLEIIAGIALLKEEIPTNPPEEFPPAPSALMAEATVLHPYAVAAYTGPLLDIGRNPLTFPCAWLFRQGVLSPWARNSRPALQGDNWWRGHAAAFLRFANVPPEALRQGRVLQTNREAVYFVVVLHQLHSVVVAIRGTESPEDLLTDGLGRERAFTDSDLCGILKNRTIPDRTRQEVALTMPHFGHVGVMEAARELTMQLDNLSDAEEISERSSLTDEHTNNSGCETSLKYDKKGLLSSLLGPGCECEGYSLRLVGHSLGGAIAAFTGFRLAERYPNLHVYTYGVLPCVDLVTAEACSPFTTSIIYNDEFSSRLSVAAIMRLRASALRALASDANTDVDLVMKLTRRLFKTSGGDSQEESDGQILKGIRRRSSIALKGGAFLCSLACQCVVQMPKHGSSSHLSSFQLAAVKQDHSWVFESELPQNTWNNEYQVTPVVASRNSLDVSGSHGDGFKEQLFRHNSSRSVTCADGEDVGIDAGTEIFEEEEAVALMSSSETERHGEEDQGDEDHPLSLELLENGMPKDTTGLGASSSKLEKLWPVEMFIPGLVIHIIRTSGSSHWFSLPTRSSSSRERPRHTAVLKDRKQFREIRVSPSMFLDHMPWKCQYAMNDILESMKMNALGEANNSVDSTANV